MDRMADDLWDDHNPHVHMIIARGLDPRLAREEKGTRPGGLWASSHHHVNGRGRFSVDHELLANNLRFIFYDIPDEIVVPVSTFYAVGVFRAVRAA